VGVAALFAGVSLVSASLLLAEKRVLAPAILLAPRSSAVVIPLAAQRLASSRAQDAVVAELRGALATDPLDHRAMIALAMAADERGDFRTARALAQRALVYNPRARQVRSWLLEDALKRGDVRSSLGHVDRLLTLAPNRRPQLLPALALLAQEPGTLSPIRAMLASRPDWTPNFVDALVAQQADPALIRALIDPVATAGPETQSRYIAMLVQRGRAREARSAWLELLPAGSKAATHVYDETFRVKEGLAPFAWRYPEQGNGSHEPVAGGGMRAFYLPNAPASLAEQTLALAPGRYRLRLSAHVTPDDATASLTWRLRCGSGPVLASVDLPKAPAPSDIAVDLSVNSDGCATQILALEGTPGESVRAVTAETRRIAIDELN